ncbi:hypothetical protein [Streptomyces sp. WP-1]|uniref:hypothetical protein n=1 Tax=Streptomyces sp. WP-1 TaxID=3041497 RepID=UPI00264A49DF|nr:hypothetical protein [Streptomyces sp. WP-1]WKE71615.1 hypothetical protein QHG49_22660 [Streptomyces sp. WP-1]
METEPHMNDEKRPTGDELMEGLRKALAADSGWIPALAGPRGPAGVGTGSTLDVLVAQLWKFATAPTTPAHVARPLARAAEAADAALTTDGATRYDALDAAYACVLQAWQAAAR